MTQATVFYSISIKENKERIFDAWKKIREKAIGLLNKNEELTKELKDSKEEIQILKELITLSFMCAWHFRFSSSLKAGFFVSHFVYSFPGFYGFYGFYGFFTVMGFLVLGICNSEKFLRSPL